MTAYSVSGTFTNFRLLPQYTLTYKIRQCIVYVSGTTYDHCSEHTAVVFDSDIAEK